ncbi:MAG: c-type cytochrome [Deltaproteobacteria bacterium]
MNKLYYWNRLIFTILLSGFWCFAYCQSVEEGKVLFESKTCAACHDRTMTKTLIGPGLAGVEDRWEKKGDLYQWIREPQKLLDAKHPYATKLFEKFNKVPMNPNTALTDKEIESILMYVKSVAEGGGQMASAGKADPLAMKGKELFQSKACAACHDIKFKSVLVGPILTGVADRWENKKDLYEWIKNPQKLLDAKHPYATALFEKFNKVPMTPSPGITDEEIDAILAFIANPPSDETTAVSGTENPYLKLKTPGPETEVSESFFSSLTFFIILLVVLLGIVFWMATIVGKARVNAFREEFNEEKSANPLIVLFGNRTVLKFAIFGFIIFGTYYSALRGIAFGRQQDYQPDQPIIYSHKVHAGDNKIDCSFCHDAARRSKHAMIPPTSTCMKCHAAIKTGTQYGTREIAKIFVSIGFNPVSNQYIENYDKMTNEEIKKLFFGWLTSENKNDTKIAEEQWQNIVSSLTNDTKPTVSGPIPWIRIHNLPDHVYFNHAQHFTVGKIECQSCHGPIQEMEVVKQFAPLSMGWCVNCHRQTDVKFTENKYYDQYFADYHKQLKEGTIKGVKVQDIGGLDCQKCHY